MSARFISYEEVISTNSRGHFQGLPVLSANGVPNTSFRPLEHNIFTSWDVCLLKIEQVSNHKNMAASITNQCNQSVI